MMYPRLLESVCLTFGHDAPVPTLDGAAAPVRSRTITAVAAGYTTHNVGLGVTTAAATVSLLCEAFTPAGHW